MLTNNIGTILYSLLNGKEIGRDQEGNKFYIHKKNKKKRWVLYKKKIDPTSLEVEWQTWLTETIFNEEKIRNDTNFKWQKSKKGNATGTADSYHPAKFSSKEEINIKKSNKDSIWKPD